MLNPCGESLEEETGALRAGGMETSSQVTLSIPLARDCLRNGPTVLGGVTPPSALLLSHVSQRICSFFAP